MIIAAGRLEEQSCRSERWTGFSARTVAGGAVDYGHARVLGVRHVHRVRCEVDGHAYRAEAGRDGGLDAVGADRWRPAGMDRHSVGRDGRPEHRHDGEQWQKNKRGPPLARFVRRSDGPDPGRARRMPPIRGPSVFRYPVVDHGPAWRARFWKLAGPGRLLRL